MCLFAGQIYANSYQLHVQFVTETRVILHQHYLFLLQEMRFIEQTNGLKGRADSFLLTSLVITILIN